MPTQNSPKRPEEQLLGEIKTWIVEMQSHGATVASGEQVKLEREPENPGNPCSIRVGRRLDDAAGRFRPDPR